MSESKSNAVRATLSSKEKATILSEIRQHGETQPDFSMCPNGDLTVPVVQEKAEANEEKLIKAIRRLQKQYRIGLDYLKDK